MDASEVERISHHEAGHAVAVELLGGMVESVRIYPERTEGVTGQTLFKRPSIAANPFAHSPSFNLQAAIAGPGAELFAKGDDLPLRAIGFVRIANSDATWIARTMAGPLREYSQPECDRLLERAWTAIRGRLIANRPAVKRLAAILRRQHCADRCLVVGVMGCKSH